MYRNKRKKKNRRNIISIAAAIVFTVVFVYVGIRIFGMPEKESKKSDKSFLAFAKLEEHMAGFGGNNTGDGQKSFDRQEIGQETKTEQESLEEKTETAEQETIEDGPVIQESLEEAAEQTEAKVSEPIVPNISENEINTVNPDSMPSETEYTFTDAPEGYFEDALFIGDSRTVGLEEYGNLEGADFFTAVGMSVYNLPKQKIDAAGERNIDIETLLSNHSYGKIYFMLGLNELGYNRQKTVDRYRVWLEYIRQMQPQAIIFIEANLHVTAKKSAEDEECRNADIDEFNNYTKELADNKSIFYVDVNELFNDGEGNLLADITYDGVHILGKYYADWGEWLRKKAIIR